MRSPYPNELLDRITSLRQVERSSLREYVRRVAVILTSSRSGSSLLKEMLVSHPDVAVLDGEMEPFFALTGNGFRFNSESDAFSRLSNVDFLADNIFDGLTLSDRDIMPLPQMKRHWYRRMLLHFPSVFCDETRRHRLLRGLDDSLAYVSMNYRTSAESALRKVILSQVYDRDPFRIDYYNRGMGPGLNRPFAETCKIEEPPFVLPALRRRLFATADAADKLLLFKTPSDAYRIGIHAELFPNADIRYVHLTRGYAQAVNGLMDGWLSPVGFFAHDLGSAGLRLDIQGYSDCVSFGRRWWKFDLPPNWNEFTSAPLSEVCLNQWMSCHRSIQDSSLPILRVPFEELLVNPTVITEKITSFLGLPPMSTAPVLPAIMATMSPAPFRWLKREKLLMALGQRPEVTAMMQGLGYEMNPDTWR